MPPNIERYCLPSSLEDLWREMARCYSPPIFLAGGTELLREHRKEHSSPAQVWIDLSRIPELSGVIEQESSLRIGATTTCTTIGQHPWIEEYAQALGQATQQFATWPIRNRCTLGGLLARGGHDGDILPALFVLDAQILCSNGSLERRVDCEDFYTQPYTCNLQPGEVILGIEIPKTKRNSVFLKRGATSPQSPAKVSIAFATALEQNHFKQVRVAVGAAGPVVHRVTTAEGLLEGQPTDYLPLLERVVLEIRRDARPASDAISSSRYRKWSVGVLARQGLRTLIQQYRHEQSLASASHDSVVFPVGL